MRGLGNPAFFRSWISSLIFLAILIGILFVMLPRLTRLQPLRQFRLVHRNIAQEPVVADSVKARTNIAFQHPLGGRFCLLRQGALLKKRHENVINGEGDILRLNVFIQ